MKKIFVSVAAQDDDELQYTIKHAFQNAEFPERVFFGIGLTAKNKKYLNILKKIAKANANVRFNYVKQKRNEISTLGIGQGRTRAASLYDNEDYMLQIDCHSYFDKGWDTKMINLHSESVKLSKNSKTIVTAIPLVYSYNSDNTVIKHEEPKTRYGTYVTNDFFVYVVPRWTEIDILDEKENGIIPAHKISPACIFGDKEFAQNPGIHNEAIFYDEDWTQQINLFGRGFSFAFPNIPDFPIRHLDGQYATKGHQRIFFTSYLSKEKQLEIHEKLKAGYLKFIEDQKNKDAIDQYLKYSKADARRGYFSLSQNPFPERFR